MTPVYSEVVTEEKITPFFRPSVSVTKLSPDELEIVYTVTLFPSAKLGEYKGLKAEKEAPSVSDKEITDAIDKLLQGNASLAVVDRPRRWATPSSLTSMAISRMRRANFKAIRRRTGVNYSLELARISSSRASKKRWSDSRAARRKTSKSPSRPTMSKTSRAKRRPSRSPSTKSKRSRSRTYRRSGQRSLDQRRRHRREAQGPREGNPPC
jgi:hypothetical protein